MQLRTLKVVRPFALSIDQLQALSAIPNLHSLQLTLENVPKGSTKPIPGFPQLRDLALSGSLQDITAFVAITSPPALGSLTISSELACHADSAIKAVEDFIKSAPALLPASTRRLRLSMTCTCASNSTVHFQNPGMLFEPLRALAGLQALEFTFTMKFHLPDSTLSALRDAWPELRVFRVASVKKPSKRRGAGEYGYEDNYIPEHEFVYRPEWAVPRARRHSNGTVVGFDEPPETPELRTDDPPTLATITAFAHAHPHLEGLEVPFLDLDNLPASNTVPVPEHALREFRVSQLPAGRPLFDCALALDALFPHLDLGDARLAVAKGEEDRMDELLLILLGLRMGRLRAHLPRATNNVLLPA
ncbi:hypothetical protein FKP32DRAFT_1675313 [Trametes sanguinea]|nr:hypothetical protein FKP32DRAFT_1675313 [Trametes sanguinea]